MSKAVTSLATKAPIWAKAAVDYSKPRLNTFIKYAKVELVPPSPAEFAKVGEGFGKLMHSAKTGAWKNLTVKEATVNTMVGMEICFWFFIGECIGKGTIVGYDV